MRTDVPELLFTNRLEFRAWLQTNAESSAGVWLVLGKTRGAVTVSANDALEEALCFGWIDGQMRSVDGTKYLKYFAKRRAKSRWSEKNKKAVEDLRSRGMMTEPGERAVLAAMKNGAWDTPGSAAVTEAQVEAFAKKLAGRSPACENFLRMPPSVRRVYAGRYLSFRTEEARERDFARIVDRLNRNLRPM